MTNTEIIATIRNEIERQIKDPQEHCYGVSSVNKLRELLSFIDSLESEKPINPADAMKEIEEKIALVKQRGTWDGVDVDKYMDEVRGREPEKPVPNDLEEAARKHSCYDEDCEGAWYEPIVRNAFIAGAKWQKEQDDRLTDIIYQQGIEKGKDDMKEQMMKEAVETTVHLEPGAFPVIEIGVSKFGLKVKDKVRVIIVKED